jgi:hypothetical protein
MLQSMHVAADVGLCTLPASNPSNVPRIHTTRVVERSTILATTTLHYIYIVHTLSAS